MVAPFSLHLLTEPRVFSISNVTCWEQMAWDYSLLLSLFLLLLSIRMLYVVIDIGGQFVLCLQTDWWGNYEYVHQPKVVWRSDSVWWSKNQDEGKVSLAVLPPAALVVDDDPAREGCSDDPAVRKGCSTMLYFAGSRTLIAAEVRHPKNRKMGNWDTAGEWHYSLGFQGVWEAVHLHERSCLFGCRESSERLGGRQNGWMEPGECLESVVGWGCRLGRSSSLGSRQSLRSFHWGERMVVDGQIYSLWREARMVNLAEEELNCVASFCQGPPLLHHHQLHLSSWLPPFCSPPPGCPCSPSSWTRPQRSQAQGMPVSSQVDVAASSLLLSFRCWCF